MPMKPNTKNHDHDPKPALEHENQCPRQYLEIVLDGKTKNDIEKLATYRSMMVRMSIQRDLTAALLLR